MKNPTSKVGLVIRFALRDTEFVGVRDRLSVAADGDNSTAVSPHLQDSPSHMLVPEHLPPSDTTQKEALFDQFLLCPPPDNRTHGSLVKLACLARGLLQRSGERKVPWLKSHGEMGVAMTFIAK